MLKTAALINQLITDQINAHWRLFTWQQLVQDELAQVFGNGDRFCTMNDTSELKFMECCIKESLRLYPTVLSIAREISEDIELDGYKIPAGTNAGLMFLSLHRNAELFSDPLTYNPERFQGDQSTGQHPFAFVPFSAGPRNCIGKLTSHKLG